MDTVEGGAVVGSLGFSSSATVATAEGESELVWVRLEINLSDDHKKKINYKFTNNFRIKCLKDTLTKIFQLYYIPYLF